MGQRSITQTARHALLGPAIGAWMLGAPVTPAGHFRLDRVASDDVSRAVEVVVRRMNILARPIARARLRNVNPLYDSVRIVVTTSTISTQFDARAPIVSPLDGTPVRWTRENGDTVLVSTRVRDGRLVQTFLGHGARRENVFTFAPDGLTLGVAVTVSSARLPRPLSYRLVYRRE